MALAFQMLALVAATLLLAPGVQGASSSRPTGLLANFQNSPALGVTATPHFSWIVPSSLSGPANQLQVAYSLTVTRAGGKTLVWASGKVVGNASTYVAYGGPALDGGVQYQWTVTTTTGTATAAATAAAAAAAAAGAAADRAAAEFESGQSAPATFVTALLDGWSPAATLVSLVPACVQGGAVSPQSNCSYYGYFRKEVQMPAGSLVSASAFITAQNWGIFDNQLSNYKLYINGELVSLGPGRGEAYVWGGESTFKSLPYTTLDVTSKLAATPGGMAVVAIEALHNGPPAGPQALLQLNLEMASGEVVTVGTDVTWQAFDGDLHRKPGPAKYGGSAGTAAGVENIDARAEPVGWRSAGFIAGRGWTAAVATNITANWHEQLTPKMEPPMQFTSEVPARSVTRVNATLFVADLGRELQGGLRLRVGDGRAGQTVHIACGESLDGAVVGSTWGWVFDWVLRDGEQLLEQHKYMECRFISLQFNGTAPNNFSVSAWRTNYPYNPADSHFESSNATLNAVFELCRYTLEAASLDTYTDSNTRERRPYEADGIIAATSRLLIQRDYLWGRHSHAWVINNPTWPIEWRQLSAFLAWQDYMATGTTDLAEAFSDPIYNRTMIQYIDKSAGGVLNTAAMCQSSVRDHIEFGDCPPGGDPNHPYGHINDWMPAANEVDETVARGEMSQSNHTSVSNMMGAHGLELLSHILAQSKDAGQKANASKMAVEAAALKKAIVAQMWNGTNFCDGICTEVAGNSSLMSNMFALCFGFVPEPNVASALGLVTDWGLEGIGDYGAFWFLMAVAGGYYSDATGKGATAYAQDDGSAVYTALTKCDTDSWCSGLTDDNLTMTRESWHDGTYSHQWGTAAIVGVVWGLMGVHQTAPTFATFTVKPKLGGLTHASITVPTIRGHITVTAPRAGGLEVDVPCNSIATLCLPRRAADNVLLTPESHQLLLDGSEVGAVSDGGHLCTEGGVGCGAAGAPRVLTTRSKQPSRRAPVKNDEGTAATSSPLPETDWFSAAGHTHRDDDDGEGPSGGARCTTPRDCFLAGECVAGRCVCDAWASGANCSMLNLAPAKPQNGLQLPGYHTWGGRSLKDEGTNTYHGYFSFMLGGCTLSSWTSNSALIHAVASTPDGPFVPEGPSVYPKMPGVMVQPWAHSANVQYSEKEQLYLLFHIGPGGVKNTGCSATGQCWNLTKGCVGKGHLLGSTQPQCWKNCSTSAAADHGAPDKWPEALGWKKNKVLLHPHPPPPPPVTGPLPAGLECRRGKDPKTGKAVLCTNFYVHTSKSLSGPWSEPVQLAVTPSVNDSSWNDWNWQANDPSMPAPFLFPNGTALVYYQATTCPAGWGNVAPACVGVMRASDWRGPYEHARSLPIVHPESEDPFVFKTKRGFHLLTNVNTYHRRCASGVPCGGHAFSEDGLEWSQQVIGAFGPRITLANGTVVHNSYVERPQVYQDPETLEPVTLYVGLTRPDGYSDSVTWAQQFCSKGQKHCGATA